MTMDADQALDRIGDMTVRQILANEAYVIMLTLGFFDSALKSARLVVRDEQGISQEILGLERDDRGVITLRVRR